MSHPWVAKGYDARQPRKRAPTASTNALVHLGHNWNMNTLPINIKILIQLISSDIIFTPSSSSDVDVIHGLAWIKPFNSNQVLEILSLRECQRPISPRLISSLVKPQHHTNHIIICRTNDPYRPSLLSSSLSLYCISRLIVGVRYGLR